MDDPRIQDAKKKLAAMNKVIAALDPAIRGSAFEILQPLYFEESAAASETFSKAKAKKGQAAPSLDDAGKFFGAFDHDKPDKNVHLIVAWLYAQYGLSPVTTSELRDMADSVGLTVPARPDATMRQAKVGGKKLYQKKGKGFQLTVHGERHVKEAYKVKKGTKARPAEDEA